MHIIEGEGERGGREEEREREEEDLQRKKIVMETDL